MGIVISNLYERFINQDTYEGDINNPLSLNLYTYVHNNPLINIDPTGHFCVSADGRNSHEGLCNSDSSYYQGYDADFKGHHIIKDGILIGLVGQPSAAYHYKDKNIKMNYWSSAGPYTNYKVNVNISLTDYVTDYGRTKENHYMRNSLNTPPKSEADAINKGWRLLPNSQSVYHQIGAGNEYNKKYVSTDGRMEAVYGTDGKLVTSPINEGTYNFTSPDNAWGHFKDDVLPYYIWGNSPDDSTGIWIKVVVTGKAVTAS